MMKTCRKVIQNYYNMSLMIEYDSLNTHCGSQTNQYINSLDTESAGFVPEAQNVFFCYSVVVSRNFEHRPPLSSPEKGVL